MSRFLKSSFLVLLVCASLSGVLCGQEKPVELKYDWKLKQKIGYEFEVEYEVDDEKKKSSGYVTYQLQKKDVELNLSNDDLEILEEGESTSTAFAVTSDGYLLTCAHCIKGAKTIQISVGDKKHEAKVVDADYARDLAVIKIDAKDLPTVPLGKSKKVELAQDVRAIGYPLSDVLGSSVKIARGSIAGFVNDANDQSLQLDVAVNPGNSGGPLVDETGAVVGIVNAKLSGAVIAKVGFAIPIKFACEMLERNKIKFESAELDAKAIGGPALAKKITPAVFFVETEIGPGGHNQFSNFKFSAKGSLKRTDGQEMVQSNAIVGADGTILDSSDETRLPLMLGTLCEMPFELLPGSIGSQKSWSESGIAMVPLPTELPKVRRETNRFDPFGLHGFRGGFPGMRGGRFGGFGPGGFGVRPGLGGNERVEIKPKMRTAIGRSTTSYKWVEQKGRLVTISKTFDLKTIGDEDEFSSLKVKHKSTLTFDGELGMFVSKKMTGEFKIKLGDKNLVVPVSMSYRQVDLDDYLKSPRKKDSGGAKPNQRVADSKMGAQGSPVKPGARTKPAEPLRLSAEMMARFLKHPSETLEDQELLVCLNRLEKWNDSPEHKTEIVEVLKTVASAEQAHFRKAAINALLNWKPESSTPFVVREFENASVFSKRDWIAKLGQTNHADGAAVLCKQLSNARLKLADGFACRRNGRAFSRREFRCLCVWRMFGHISQNWIRNFNWPDKKINGEQ